MATKLRTYFCGYGVVFIFMFQKMFRSSSCMVSRFFLIFILTRNRCGSQQGSPRVFQTDFQSDFNGLTCRYSHDGRNDGENIAHVLILPNYLFIKYPNVSVCFIQFYKKKWWCIFSELTEIWARTYNYIPLHGYIFYIVYCVERLTKMYSISLITFSQHVGLYTMRWSISLLIIEMM